MKNKKPTINPPITDGLLEVALYLRASLFFFEISYITPSRESAVVILEGAIYCRLDAGTPAIRSLVEKTLEFRILGTTTNIISRDPENPFKQNVSIQVDSKAKDKLLFIEAKFEEGYYATISGFPCALKDIQRHMPQC